MVLTLSANQGECGCEVVKHMALLLAASHTQALLASLLANLPSAGGRCRHDQSPKHVQKPLYPVCFAWATCCFQFWVQPPLPRLFFSHNVPTYRDPRKVCVRCSPQKP